MARAGLLRVEPDPVGLFLGDLALLTPVVRRRLARSGGIGFTPQNDWKFRHLHWKPDDWVEDDAHRQGYVFLLPDVSSGPYSNLAAYQFSAEFLNRADTSEALQDVEVVFVKDGTPLFVHRPFDPKDETANAFYFDRSPERADGRVEAR